MNAVTANTQPSGNPSDGPRSDEILIEVRNLTKEFPVGTGSIFRRRSQTIKAVQDVTFNIRPGETLGLVGESGSGKTTLGRSIIRLLEPTSGEVLLDGVDVSSLNRSELQRARRRMQIIFCLLYTSPSPRD